MRTGKIWGWGWNQEASGSEKRERNWNEERSKLKRSYQCKTLRFFLLINLRQHNLLGLPRRLGSKESACSAAGVCLIPGSGRFSGGGNGNSLQYSCLKNSTDREAWCATVHGSQTQLNTHTHTMQPLTQPTQSPLPLC